MDAREITQQQSPALCSLVPFETTSALLREVEAVALLNFAALFHEQVYLTDTVLGDFQILISSFQGLLEDADTFFPHAA
jgi:hypothetical protein